MNIHFDSWSYMQFWFKSESHSIMQNKFKSDLSWIHKITKFSLKSKTICITSYSCQIKRNKRTNNDRIALNLEQHLFTKKAFTKIFRENKIYKKKKKKNVNWKFSHLRQPGQHNKGAQILQSLKPEKQMGDSSLLPLFLKLFGNMLLFWNYIGPCPWFETRFSQNWVSMKTSLGLKSSYVWSNFKKKKKIAWNSSSI